MKYSELTSPEIGAVAPETIALLPIAATEQHGSHLAVNTDTALVSEIASLAEMTLSESLLLLPTLWVGSSHHHLGFPGTLSIRGDTYIKVLEDLVDSLVASGFRRILLLNGHGGNITPMTEALYRLALRHDDVEAPWIVGLTYFIGLAKSKWEFMETEKLTHACEFETSMMLALNAKWVQMDLARGTCAKRHSRYYDPSGYNPSRVVVCETFARMTSNGAMGSPEKASPEKGERLLSTYSDSLIEFLREFSGWPMKRENE